MSASMTDWADDFDPDRPPDPTASDCRYVRTLRRLVVAEAVATAVLVPVELLGGFVVGNVADRRGLVLGPAPEIVGVVLLASCCLLAVCVPLSVICWVGLYNLKAWSRWLYLAVTAFMSLFGMAVGVIDFSIQWGLIVALEQVAGMLSGALLAMAFWSPAADRFSLR